ncbi:hypothetical protein HDV06_002629, partial [Boothiomyces sp. JEL0866]
SLGELTSTNKTLTGFNKFSKKRFNEISIDFNFIDQMHKDLLNVISRTRQLRAKIQKDFPEQYEQVIAEIGQRFAFKMFNIPPPTIPRKKGELYQPVPPYHAFGFPCHNFHELYVELVGQVIFTNAGEGTVEDDRRLFSAEKYRIIIVHQRGSGRSKPAASLEDNDTWSLIYDIEKIRRHCTIDRWVVYGDGWGTTLGLAYAIQHPYRVKAIILRGVFLMRPCELDWFYKEGGASNVFPEHWENFVSLIPPEERNDLIAAYYKRLTSENEEEMLAAAKSWCRWELSASKLVPSSSILKRLDDHLWVLQYSRIQCHYFLNKGFFKSDNYILDNVHKIAEIPCHIIHGRYDMVRPYRSAWELKQKWPIAKLHTMSTSGHASTEKATTSQILECGDDFQTML